MSDKKLTPKVLSALRESIDAYEDYLHEIEDVRRLFNLSPAKIRLFVAGIAYSLYAGDLDEWPDDAWVTSQFERFLALQPPYPETICHDGGMWVVTGPEDDPRT